MKLDIYVMDDHKLDIRPAPAEREWMDKTDQKYAYRCLPLNIANAFGWEILCTEGVIARWNGGPDIKDVTVMNFSYQPYSAQAASHFSHGILTFHIPCLFKTEAGISLFAHGPTNRPKDGIYPLTGVIETDWSPYTFTMNWIFTRPGTVYFEKGEPFCHVFPVSCDDMETITPEVKPLSTNPELQKAYGIWADRRDKFIKDLGVPESEARKEKWQKLYYRGLMPNGCPVEKHRTKLKVKSP